ncbi:MAG: hypothetical protein KJ949_00060 [Nanoarchaeota archaeon]|nr:hypothetical protein [Nanoarchaeota archaeon]MBU4308288.1 hypothetical protein [Nanoarchaeota archaeon]
MKIKKDKSAFLEYVGDTPQLRVLDFFIGNHFFDFPLTEIARESEVSYNSLKVVLPKFLEREILVKSRRVGKSDYYKFNMENEFVKNIIKISWMLVKKDLFREVEVKA